MTTSDEPKVALAVVEIDSQFDLPQAQEVLSQWLLDRPEVADSVTIVLTHRDGLQPACVKACDQVLSQGVGLSVLVCGPHAHALGNDFEVVRVEVASIVNQASLVEVLEDLTSTVSFVPGVPSPDMGEDKAAENSPPLTHLSQDAEEGITAQMLYIASLGNAHKSRRRGRWWPQELVDIIAAHSGDRLVRLLALGDGIVGQSPLGLAGDFASGAPNWSTKRWPKSDGRLDMREALSAISAQHHRDIQQAAFEGVRVTQTTLVMNLQDAVSGVIHLRDQISDLRTRMQLVVVASDDRVLRMYEELSAGQAFTWHPELAAEVARALGVGPRSLNGRLQTMTSARRQREG
jgi:hypothetical protein